MSKMKSDIFDRGGKGNGFRPSDYAESGGAY